MRGSGCSFNTGPTWRTCLLSYVVAQTGIDDQRCAPQRAWWGVAPVCVAVAAD